MRIVLLTILFLLLITTVSAETFTNFYGDVEDGKDGELVKASINNKEFLINVSNGKYGYYPSFTVYGKDGGAVLFYFRNNNLFNSTIKKEATIKLDILSKRTRLLKKLKDEQQKEVKQSQVKEKPINQFKETKKEAKKQYKEDFPKDYSWIFMTITIFVLILAFTSFKMIHSKKDYRINEIKSYYKTNLSKGYTKEMLREKLLSSGYRNDEINKALNSIK